MFVPDADEWSHLRIRNSVRENSAVTPYKRYDLSPPHLFVSPPVLWAIPLYWKTACMSYTSGDLISLFLSAACCLWNTSRIVQSYNVLVQKRYHLPCYSQENTLALLIGSFLFPLLTWRKYKAFVVPLYQAPCGHWLSVWQQPKSPRFVWSSYSSSFIAIHKIA